VGAPTAPPLLLRADEQARLALEAAGVGTWIWDIAAGAVVWSDQQQVLHGLAPGTFGGTDEAFRAVLHPDDVAHVVSTIDRALAARGDHRLEYRVRWPDGGVRWIAGSGRVVCDDAGEPLGMLGVAMDVTDRHDAEAEQAFLAEVGAALVGPLDDGAILAAIARLAVPRWADLCLVDVIEDDGRPRRAAVTHADPVQEAGVWTMPALPPGSPDPTIEAAGGPPADRPRIVAEILAPVAGGGADGLAALGTIGMRSALLVPLVARDRSLGVLVFAAGAGRTYGPRDLALGEEVARRAAVAVDHARLYAAEQRAREAAEHATARLVRLQAVTEALAGALTVDDVAAVVVAQGIAALGAAAGSLVLPTADGVAYEIVATVGYPSVALAAWRRIPADAPVPLVEAVRRAAPVVVPTLADLAARYPALATSPAANLYPALATLPLLTDGRAIGALGLSFAEERAFGDDDLAFMLAIARQCAQALERARLYAAERAARDRTEAARERLAFLAEASTTLSVSLEYEATLTAIARLVVPRLADWCAVQIAGEDGVVTPVAITHTDPAKEAWARELTERYPSDPTAATGVPRVLRTGQADLYPDIADEVLIAAARDAAHLALLREVGMRSAMVVPLAARERVFGAVTLVSAESGRRYDADDLALAEDLAQRCAVAIENARLYREAREAVRARDEFLSIASHELRTPVTSIKGYAQMLLRLQTRDGAGLDPARLGRFVRTIDEASDRLGVLTNDLLDVSRIRLGELPLRLVPLDLAALADATAARGRGPFDEGEETLHPVTVYVVGAPAPVPADPDRIEQVLSNLLANAAKYSPAGGPIDVTVEPVEGGVLLSVADRGIGLPPGETETIFEPFGRAANATRDKLPGMGLGLAICRGIAERHDGRIWAESDGEGRGTTIRLFLPETNDRE